MYHGNSFGLITWYLLQTPRSVSPESVREMLAWKVKASNIKKQSSWSLVLAFMSSRNHTNIPVVSAAGVLTTTPSSTDSANCGIARGGCRWHQTWCGGHFLLPRWHTVLQWGWGNTIDAWCCVTRGKFRELLPIFTTRHLSPKVCSKVYVAWFRSAVLHISKM